MLSLKNLLSPKAALFKLLEYSGINIDFNMVKDELDKHPDSASLLGVCDVLTALNIENSAFRISIDELPGMPCPFLAHVNLNRGDLLVVTRIDEDSVYVSNDKWEKHRISTDDFKKMFTGVVLTVESTDSFPETAAKNKLKALKLPVIIASLGLILISAMVFNTGYFTSVSWQLIALTIFKSAGLITSVLLLIQSIDNNNPLVQIVCESVGKTNCNNILSSKAAKVFEGLTWSEVGFFYFAGTWLLLLFGGGAALTWAALAVLNFISLPYTVYSIYYQARVAKQWCVLCCTVQALLWLEFIPLIDNISKDMFSFNEYNLSGAISAMFICLLAPVLLWIILKPLLLKLQQLPLLKEQLHKFKYNTELFNKLLTEQPKYALPSEEWCIALGNVEADNIFTIATNPYCPPCATMHKLMDDLLDQSGSIQARIVFTTQNNETDRNTPISRHLMALSELPDKTIIKQALHDWYGQKQKNYEEWAKTYPVQLNEATFYKLDKQKDWVKMAEISGTPTLLLNGHIMPGLYQLPDLKYMLQ